MPGFLARLAQIEGVNFWLTNRIPRRSLTRFMGWFSKIEHPLVRDLSLRVWRMFSDLDLSEARRSDFRSLHDCFTRELKDGARPIHPDPAILTSPCDAIIGACGQVRDGMVIQAKGFPYPIDELLADPLLARRFGEGVYVTMRLTSTMYHRFHAPAECRVRRVTYIPGDVWNVNPVALKRVERLYCRNERAVIRAEVAGGGDVIALVPVAAVLVASIRLHFADVLLHMGYRGPRELVCDATLLKGQEMGWFEHGSTIIVFAPRGYDLCEPVAPGHRIRMGEPLLRLPQSPVPEKATGNSAAS